jgi:hypothetical protein
MKAARWARVALLGVAGASLAGCGTTLISHPIERQSDGWTIRLVSMAEEPAPAGVLAPATIHRPDDGKRPLYVVLQIRNDEGTRRPFSYESCDLDLGSESVRPGVVTNYIGVARHFDATEPYDAGEQSARSLTFSYPDGRYPTRLKCQGITIAFPMLMASR